MIAVMTVKMKLQLLMLILMTRVAEVAVEALIVTVASFGRISTIITRNVKFFQAILDMGTLRQIVAILCLCFYNFSIIVGTNHYVEQLKNSKGSIFTFRSLLRQWTPVQKIKFMLCSI